MESLKKPETRFLIMETLLYCGFLLEDLRTAHAVSTVLKYLSILVCLWFVTLRAMVGGEWSMVLALVLTAAADELLLVSQRHYILGIFLFLCVQVLYAIRIGKENRYTLMLRTGLVLLIWVGLWRTGLAIGVNLMAGLYFPQLLCNTVFALRLQSPWGRLFSLGLLYFVACDVFVGLWNLRPWLSGEVEKAVGLGMWMCYLPAQVCIALSVWKK